MKRAGRFHLVNHGSAAIKTPSASRVRTVYLTLLTFFALFGAMLGVVVISVVTLGRAQNFITTTLGSWLGRFVLGCAGVRIKFQYLEKPVRSPAIFIGNHSSTLDIFLILALRLPRVRFVAKYEFLYNPLFAIMGLLTGQIFVKRQDSAQAVAALNRAYNRIRRRRHSLFIMPEGTRIEDGTIGVFKKGAFHMAMDLQYPIVPIFFGGARRLCPGKSLQVRPGTVLLRFHPAEDTSTWTPDNLDAQIARIRENYVRWDQEFMANYEAMLAT
ncbi:MAG: 1-acyl-sn-glycerol-3-phosphate acyltransferase [candidate division KSB1 bacterium]|nr:1-acyl-sn-glycerol-3-phosphate acyltransferase [candidate division KSB1 bacterium]MDZ7274558.1 1-acyl-sn-glycerol-3-phosphate acyltransferase [candidate division KSB1 bacterium]MDZ7284781.1 1-acyl-sn-glycerol-3-phosphate acyltransferase [candidate division KSB1 bacterium]MDZ7297799.1 1-acyl-sn-glycerol-3-phosphate acyltransferase [candidate division KSB1 bacterium]MDZ7306412.1 1-acyl-sn-glycerol-3-phosphate acyltransferase [candidate division KSB1 bacterium]